MSFRSLRNVFSLASFHTRCDKEIFFIVLIVSYVSERLVTSKPIAERLTVELSLLFYQLSFVVAGLPCLVFKANPLPLLKIIIDLIIVRYSTKT